MLLGRGCAFIYELFDIPYASHGDSAIWINHSRSVVWTRGNYCYIDDVVRCSCPLSADNALVIRLRLDCSGQLLSASFVLLHELAIIVSILCVNSVENWSCAKFRSYLCKKSCFAQFLILPGLGFLIILFLSPCVLGFV